MSLEHKARLSVKPLYLASDNTYYVSQGFASVTSFAPKSILTDAAV